jgi:predicted thioesterase
MPAGFQTVERTSTCGTFAATPVGMTVQARAELVSIEGRTLKFR